MTAYPVGIVLGPVTNESRQGALADSPLPGDETDAEGALGAPADETVKPLGTEPSCAGRLRSSPTPGWRSGTPSICCQIPAFSVRWMVMACEGKKEGSCGPSWTYVTSCRDCELLLGGLISVRSVVRIYPGPLDLRRSGVHARQLDPDPASRYSASAFLSRSSRTTLPDAPF